MNQEITVASGPVAVRPHSLMPPQPATDSRTAAEIEAQFFLLETLPSGLAIALKELAQTERSCLAERMFRAMDRFRVWHHANELAG